MNVNIDFFLSFLVTFDEHKNNFVSALCVCFEIAIFFSNISKYFESKWVFVDH